MANLPLLIEVVNQICQNPETHNQSIFHSLCGTVHCVAGWAQIKAGMLPCSNTAEEDAQLALGLSREEAGWLFSSRRSLPEIHSFAATLIRGEKYFGKDGFSRDGFDHDGYNRAGFYRNDRDREGRDRTGYTRDGRDAKNNKLPILTM